MISMAHVLPKSASLGVFEVVDEDIIIQFLGYENCNMNIFLTSFE